MVIEKRNTTKTKEIISIKRGARITERSYEDRNKAYSLLHIVSIQICASHSKSFLSYGQKIYASEEQ